MLDFFFKWLRDRSRAAIHDGIANAVEELTAETETVSPRLAALAAKLAPVPALPAAEDDDVKPARTKKTTAVK